MTKLYHEAGAWVVPGKQGRKAERLDVPNSPEDLASWLNARAVPISQLASEGEEPIAELELERPWVRGPEAPNPPRYATTEEAAADAGVVFVPIDKAAEIDRLLGRCPRCSGGPEAAAMWRQLAELEGIEAWIAKCDSVSAIEAIALAVKDRIGEFKVDLEEEGTVQ